MTIIIVTDHALARARQRYGLVNIDRDVIVDDVMLALRAGRGGHEHPHPNGDGPLCDDGGIYVWTACLKRIYVVRAVVRKRRTTLHVVTAIPGVRSSDHLPDWRLRKAA